MTDYERIASAIAFIARHKDRQPALALVASHVHMSPFHFQRLFCRWAGVTPKRFLQVLTVEHAKRLMAASESLLALSYSVGLSSGSRLYDHFVRIEAVTPGEHKTGGAGLAIAYGTHDTPFGEAFVAVTPRGICRLAFVDGAGADACLAELRAQWPRAEMREDAATTGGMLRAVFGQAPPPGAGGPLSLYVSGTNFQVSVWRALLGVAPATLASYARIAAAVGCPGGARAAGQAVGANPVAFLIPCHRVIAQSGAWGGYRWGETRKRAIHAWEAARSETLEP